MKIAFISANLGNNEKDYQDKHVKQSSGDIDFFYFTDTNYKPRDVMHPRLQAKIPKMLGWELCPNYDIYIWADACITLTHKNSVSELLNQLGKSDIAFFRHPEGRNSIFYEKMHMDEHMSGRVNVNSGYEYLNERYKSEPIEQQVKRYLDDPQFKDDKLYAAGLFIYRNKQNVKDMLSNWLFHNFVYTIQDQISLPYVLSKSSCTVSTIDENIFHNDYIKRWRNVLEIEPIIEKPVIISNPDMKVSIFTPTHDSSYLLKVYESLKEQTYQNWEWVILYNNGASIIKFNDERVKNIDAGNIPKLVGYAKKLACEYCTGDIYLELDHDDLLMPNALEETVKSFQDNEVVFAYSNDIFCNTDLERIDKFAEGYGWQYRDIEYKGHRLFETIHFPPDPATITRIWFAPNHLRAFRASTYKQIGGYNGEMRVLDDLEIMCRMYLAGKFAWIDKGLYVYRIHGENTWLKYNKEIQDNVYRLHDEYIESVVDVWCDREGLKKVELGGRVAARKGYTTVDLKEADIIHDLNTPWPFEDSSVGCIRAYDVFEHLKDPLFVMSELFRVLSPKGWAFIQVPSTDGRGAFMDPRHVSFWNENSFLYYIKSEFGRFYDNKIRFQMIRGYTTPINELNVCWVKAQLLSLKDDYRAPGIIEI